jgi:hypothetical protein
VKISEPKEISEFVSSQFELLANTSTDIKINPDFEKLLQDAFELFEAFLESKSNNAQRRAHLKTES